MRRNKNPAHISNVLHARTTPFRFRVMWGILLFLLLLLPVFNHLIQLLPLRKLQEGGILVWYSSDLFTSLAVITNGAMVIRMFQLYRFTAFEDNKTLWEKTLNSFGFSLLSLVTYLALLITLRDQLSSLHLGQNSTNQLYVETVLLALYILFFSLVCRGVYLLGIRYIPLYKNTTASS